MVINKRLLIKNLLAHHNENSFYDKKRQLNLHTKQGKARFLKHICALSNSNPVNNSYIIVGVEDENNAITGTDFYDDSKIQNLVNAYLINPPKIQYENISFPNLPTSKVIGLVTIQPTNKIASFKKRIYTILPQTTFVRIGSTSVPSADKIVFSKINKETVINIENSSRNSIKHTLDAVVGFITNKHNNLFSEYLVFKELFVVCWSGIEHTYKNKAFYSRVDIELINEQIKLFYSTQDKVVIKYNNHSFIITEYISLGVNNQINHYPLEEVSINFYNNGYYKIETKMLFNPPLFDKKLMHHIYNANLSLLKKMKMERPLSKQEEKDIENIPQQLLLCYINGFLDAKEQLIEAKPLLKKKKNTTEVYVYFKEVMRVFRKMKYN